MEIGDEEEPPGVADCHERDSSAVRAAAARWWPDVPCASGSQIVSALRRIGLDARVGGPDHAILIQGHTSLAIVPLTDPVHPAVLLALLNTLGITPEQLAELLTKP
jgi:hypothetical protein